jgi:uncharacterized protein YcbK (DUF882 family)
MRNLGGFGGAASRAAIAVAFLGVWIAPDCTESAVANGDTRSVSFMNRHTDETASFTYMVNGVYDSAVLEKLNWFMRDWRLNEPTKMDPRLFDIVWEVYRESGSQEPIDVLSGYRSPQTNAMLRRRSRQVAEHSQHMQGRAIDAHFNDVSPARIRDIAMRMQEGGVGFYPQGVTWVHIDSGSVRYWPRMSRAALTRLFPDGKTVFVPSDGQPMPGYELAKAEIEQRGDGAQFAGSGGGGLFAWLFGARGGGDDDAEESGGQEAIAVNGSGGRGGRNGGPQAPVAPSVEIAEAGPVAVEKAKRNLPAGQTYASAPEPVATPQPQPQPEPQPQVVAAIEQPQVESDASAEAAPEPASPVKLRGPVAALFLAPLPPRRPSDLTFQLAGFTAFPLPPSRPTDLFAPAAPAVAPAMPPARPATLASAAVAPDTMASFSPAPPSIQAVSYAPSRDVGARSVPASHGEDLVADVLHSRLPNVITRGLVGQPHAALALAELPPSPTVADDRALLARAAELTAPLPPMPIPELAAAPAAAQPEPQPVQKTASLSSLEKVKRLFSGLNPFRAISPPKTDAEPQ